MKIPSLFPNWLGFLLFLAVTLGVWLGILTNMNLIKQRALLLQALEECQGPKIVACCRQEMELKGWPIKP